MAHEATQTRAEEWGPTTVTCSCGWVKTRPTSIAAMAEHYAHRHPGQQSEVRGFCAPWGAAGV